MFAKLIRIALLGIIGVAGLLCWDLARVNAQTISNSTVQSVLQSLGQSTSVGSSPVSSAVPPPAPPVVVPPSVTTSSQMLAPAAPPTTAQLPASTLELVFSQRAGQPLQQFGYDIFGIGQSVAVTQIGNVQDNYVLGAGDQLTVVCRGHDTNTYVVPVDRDGRVLIPGYDPVQAAGRTFGQVRSDIAAVVAKDALKTQAYVSLAQTRQINVLVSGEVNAPGVRTVSGLNTPIDALLLSGGIRKTGSLRNIVLIRGTKHIPIDLYAVIARGNLALDGNLVDGDRIIVPPIGPTAAVIGLVNRPGIYELAAGAHAIDGQALIRLAGGAFAGANHLSRVLLESSGRMQLVSLGRDGIIGNGEILSVDQQSGAFTGGVVLAGAVQLPGTRPLTEASTLRQLLKDPEEMSPGAYAPFAIATHQDPSTGVRVPYVFSLTKIFDGEEDKNLASGDVVFIFTASQARALANAGAAQLQLEAQQGSVPPSVLTQVLTGSQAQGAQTAPSTLPTTSTSATPSTTTTTTTPTNNAAAIYAGSSSGLGVGSVANTAATSTQTAANTPSTSSSMTAPTLPSLTQAIGTGVGNAIMGVSPAGSPTSTATTLSPTTGVPMIGTLPTPPMAPFDARTAAAASRQPLPSVALLQAQGAQSATSGVPPQGGGLTTPAALGSPAPDTNPSDMATELGLTLATLTNLAADHVVTIEGDVHDPGTYVADDGTSLGAMLDAAGGLEVQADLSSVQVTSTIVDASTGTSKTLRNAYSGNRRADFDKVALRPLDTVVVRQVFGDRESGTVTIVGQIRYPGSFDILRNERLSSLITRAGGLTDEAYPYGTVFTRISAQQEQAEGNYREAVELQTGALEAATTPNVNPAILTYLQSLVATLQHQPALGRISVESDPTILAVKPQLDTLLQPGDFIYIPKRPSTVSVSGEVFDPGSFQYRPGMSVDDYLKLAGGTTQVSDEGSTFVILPDGSARPASSDFFDFFGSDPIPPGSTIVVPPDPAPFNAIVFATQLSQIIGQIAIAGASLSVISNK